MFDAYSDYVFCGQIRLSSVPLFAQMQLNFERAMNFCRSKRGYIFSAA